MEKGAPKDTCVCAFVSCLVFQMTKKRREERGRFPSQEPPLRAARFIALCTDSSWLFPSSKKKKGWDVAGTRSRRPLIPSTFFLLSLSLLKFVIIIVVWLVCCGLLLEYSNRGRTRNCSCREQNSSTTPPAHTYASAH